MDDAANLLGVSKRLLQDAYKVLTKALPEVGALVEDGKLPVNRAAKLADATPEQQHEAVNIIKMGGKCPTFKPGEEKAKLPTLKIQLVVWLKSALEMPVDSQERVEELAKLFKTISAEAFGKNTPRKEFLQRVAEECAEYGIAPPVFASEVEYEGSRVKKIDGGSHCSH